MSLDIVIPAYNEADRIGATLWAYRQRFPGSGTRILVALDGCTDGTAREVRSHQQRDARVLLLCYPKLGKGGVIAESFRRCGGDLVGFVDADGATPPSEFARLVEAARHADGAIASRRHPAGVAPTPRPASRRAASSLLAVTVRHLFRLPYTDTQCGAKVFRRDVLDRVLPLLSTRDLLFDVDLLTVARRLRFRVVELPTVWIDQPGSRVELRTAGRLLLSVLALWLRHCSDPVRRDGRPAVGAGRPPSAPPARVDGVGGSREVLTGARHGLLGPPGSTLGSARQPAGRGPRVRT